jgi:hypothetical protein
MTQRPTQRPRPVISALKAPHRGEAGEGRLAFLFWLVIAGFLVTVSIQSIPVLISANRYQDYMIETAEKRWGIPKSRLEKELVERGQELELPVTKDDVQISVSSKRILIQVQYTVPIDFLVYTYQWHKVHEVNREIYRF